MVLKVNGKEFIYDKPEISINEILKVNKVEQPDMVSVQLNGEFVNKENYKTTIAKEKDDIDFLYFMGGGCGDLLMW